MDPLRHYETYGWKEGRDPSATFGTNKYLAAYADVKAAKLDPLLHYVVFGRNEGRTAFGA
jgi:serralysin